MYLFEEVICKTHFTQKGQKVTYATDPYKIFVRDYDYSENLRIYEE